MRLELSIGCCIIGERRCMLQAMLHQRAAAVLAGLAKPCERALKAYARQPEALGRALLPWTERALRTRQTLETALEVSS